MFRFSECNSNHLTIGVVCLKILADWIAFDHFMAASKVASWKDGFKSLDSMHCLFGVFKLEWVELKMTIVKLVVLCFQIDLKLQRLYLVFI